MLRIYGCSDDLVEIEGSYCDEIGCFEPDVRIWFSDGTIIRVGYPKRPGLAVWKIEIEKDGTAERTLTVCEDEDAEIYSDVFEIDAHIVRHEVIDKEKKE